MRALCVSHPHPPSPTHVKHGPITTDLQKTLIRYKLQKHSMSSVQKRAKHIMTWGRKIRTKNMSAE